MRDCTCYSHNRDIVIDTFRVSSHLTILRCTKCGGKIAEWIDKIIIPKKFDKETLHLYK